MLPFGCPSCSVPVQYSTVDTLIRYTYVVGTVLTHMGHRYVSLHAILNGGKAAAPLPYVGESLKNASPERAPVGVLSPQRQYTEDVARLSKRSLGTVGPASLRFHRGCGVNHVIFIGSESEKVRGEKRDGEMPHICGCHSIFSGGSLTSFPGSVRSTAPFGRGRTARKQPGAASGIRDNGRPQRRRNAGKRGRCMPIPEAKKKQEFLIAPSLNPLRLHRVLLIGWPNLLCHHLYHHRTVQTTPEYPLFHPAAGETQPTPPGRPAVAQRLSDSDAATPPQALGLRVRLSLWWSWVGSHRVLYLPSGYLRGASAATSEKEKKSAADFTS